MAGSGKSGGWLGGLGALLQQWQVVVTGIAAATALWFGFADQRRKEVEVNREAVTAAKTVPAEAFALDPYATLAEFRSPTPSTPSARRSAPFSPRPPGRLPPPTLRLRAG